MRLWVEPSALVEIAALPGHVRQRVRRALSNLRETPRPSQSRTWSGIIKTDSQTYVSLCS
jgi:hypothetical protein